MLSEKRSRSKWVLTPRKSSWTADENNLGRKLMERMGWSSGKGLGSQEQGMKESISVRYKNDIKGIGYKGPVDDPVQLQDQFSELLAELNQSPDSVVLSTTNQEDDPVGLTPNNVLSLEKRSLSSKSRVHYSKFTRGKDLSRYSEKDLQCILGAGKNKESKVKKKETSESDPSFGIQTTTAGSMNDYFKNKMISKGLLKSEIAVTPNISSEVDKFDQISNKKAEDSFQSGIQISRGLMDDYFKAKMASKENVKNYSDVKQHQSEESGNSLAETENLTGDADGRKKKRRKHKGQSKTCDSELSYVEDSGIKKKNKRKDKNNSEVENDGAYSGCKKHANSESLLDEDAVPKKKLKLKKKKIKNEKITSKIEETDATCSSIKEEILRKKKRKRKNND